MNSPSLVLSVALVLLAGYVSGSLPWGLWLGKWLKGVDVRTLGSGNLGATNVYRSLGPGVGVATLVLDVTKGLLPVLLVPDLPFARGFPGGREWCTLAVGLAAVAGHVWTFLAGFRGGKGVATTAGVLLGLAPLAFTGFAVAFVAALAVTRYVSLGSILGSVAFAVVLALTAPGGVRSPRFVLGALLAVLVIVRHRDNIRRLRAGTERRFAFTKEASA